MYFDVLQSAIRTFSLTNSQCTSDLRHTYSDFFTSKPQFINDLCMTYLYSDFNDRMITARASNRQWYIPCVQYRFSNFADVSIFFCLLSYVIVTGFHDRPIYLLDMLPPISSLVNRYWALSAIYNYERVCGFTCAKINIVRYQLSPCCHH